MTTKTRYPVLRNCNLSSRTDDRGSMVLAAIQWADDGRLDANISDEEAVLDALDDLEETLADGAGERDDAAAASACAAAEERVATLLRASRAWVLDTIAGLRIDDPKAVAAMERCDWANVMPVIDGDRRLTGRWVYWDTDDQTFANYDDEAAIDRDDAVEAGWTVDEDGYATPPLA
jgi:hypothetical protein